MVFTSSNRARIEILVALDVALILAAHLLGYVARFSGWLPFVQLNDPKFALYASYAVAFTPVWLLMIASEGGYNRRHLLVGTEEYRRLFRAISIAVLLSTLVIFLLKADLSRAWMLTSWAMAVLLLSFGRHYYRHHIHKLNRKRGPRNKVLVVGANQEAADLVAAIDSTPHLGSSVLGVLGGEGPADPRLRVLGGLDDLHAHISQLKPDAVVIVPSALGSSAGAAYELLKNQDCSLYIAPSLRDVVASRVSVHPIGDFPLIRLEAARIDGFPKYLKRAFDLSMGALVIAVGLPFFLLIALAVRSDSRGSVLFKQRRVGRDGREFMMYKFRSMVDRAESLLPNLEQLNEADGGVIFKMKDDPRVTKVGAFLRKWSLDEFPQLINVVKGDMSLVGPRPPLPSEVAEYNQWHRSRLGTVPGMTGYWQVSGRSDVSFKQMVKMDIFYIENWSLSFDLHILIRTVGAVLSRRGAY